jgi:hypothetical protein
MGSVALILGAMSAWVAYQWMPAWIPASLFFFTALSLFWLHFRPAIEVTDREISIGQRSFAWSSITKIQTTGWLTPLVLRLTMDDGSKAVLIYPGDLESSSRLREIVTSCAPHALLDGQPQRKRQATIAVRDNKNERTERYPLLTREDEAEVERMFQRLREVGNLDSQSSSSEDK